MAKKSTKDALGDRMKDSYENRSKTFLTRRVPVIIRLDGKAFHSFTKGFQRPYDSIFHTAMDKTLQYLCENIQGCKFGYTQSDEITLVLTDYETIQTCAWFDNNVQKICSISASMATFAFNKYFAEAVNEEFNKSLSSLEVVKQLYGNTDNFDKVFNNYFNKINKGAMFDSRCFSVPQSEVINCLIWRQQDATRNAIQMLGQTHFSHKQLNEKSTADIQDMLMLEKGINFNDMPVAFKRGVGCYRAEIPVTKVVDGETVTVMRHKWILDYNIPIFSQDREYLSQKIPKVD